MLGGRKPDIKVGGDFSTVPADKYTVQVADVNFKVRFNKFKNEEVEGLNFQFTILDDKPSEDADGSTRGHYLWHFMSQSLSSRSWLLKLARAVYGRDLTPEELNPSSPQFFNPENLVGKQVDVMVTEDPSKDGTTTYNNIVSYSKTVKPLEPWIQDQRVGQAVVESATKPATPVSTAPSVLENPVLDDFIESLEGTTEKDFEEDAEVKALEEQLKKAKQAKKSLNMAN